LGQGARRRFSQEDGLAILKRLDAEDRLTADQKGWIPALENMLAERI